MFRARGRWDQFSKRLKILQTRSFCSKSQVPTNKFRKNNGESKVESDLSSYDDAYKQLDKLDFMSASKILFTNPPKKKKFGIDFHLVQLFFVCLPSLAVYLVAQYSRYEMRKMEADLERKKKKEEEEKAKEMELEDTEEKNPELQEVKIRLEKLEETVKEIAVKSRKQLEGDLTKHPGKGGNDKARHETNIDPRNSGNISESSKSIKNHLGTENAPFFPGPSASESKAEPGTSREDNKKLNPSE